jgi:hypothetical protein
MHCWIFVNEKNYAIFNFYDDSNIIYDNNQINIKDENKKIYILQIPVEKFPNKITSKEKEIRKIEKWEDLVVRRRDFISCWSIDLKKNTLWIRLQPEDYLMIRLHFTQY